MNHRRCCLLLTALLLAGCAGTTPRDTPAPAISGPAVQAGADTDQGSWWSIRFRIRYPVGEAPRWHLGPYLADRVLRPSLARHEPALYRWRIHRRAVHDGYGHHFSFIFHTSAATARQMFDEVNQHPELTDLLTSGEVEKAFLAPAGDHRLAATSDPGWPDKLQPHWPLFAMGASAMWLQLVAECGADVVPPETLAQKLDYYRQCQAEVSALWRQWGQHAFLHHLSGIFAYQPMRLQRDIRF